MGSFCCPDCGQEHFGNAEFCKRCGADFNRREPYSRFLHRKSAFKRRHKAGLLLDLLDVLEDYGGPWGLSVRLSRPPETPEPK